MDQIPPNELPFWLKSKLENEHKKADLEEASEMRAGSTLLGQDKLDGTSVKDVSEIESKRLTSDPDASLVQQQKHKDTVTSRSMIEQQSEKGMSSQ